MFMQDKQYCVYIHYNRINGKRYIGQTCQKPVSARWGHEGNGYKHTNTHFYSAIQKYGWNNFDHIIYKDGLTLEEANELEEELINEYNTLDTNFGYNQRHGGSNGRLSPEHIEKISIANTGRVKSEEAIRKFSEARMGHPVSAETREILRQANLGNKHSEETKRLISEKNTGKHWYNNGEKNVFCFEKPDGYVEGMLPSKAPKQSRSTKGRPHTEEHKQHIREALLQRNFNGKAIKCEETGMVFKSINDASRELAIDRRSIKRQLEGKYEHTHGFHFVYVEEVA